MDELHPYILCVILCVMDKSKTPEELEGNRKAAVADASAACADYASGKLITAYAAYAACAAYASVACADTTDADTADAKFWLNQYFEHTGENREDYENELNKEK